ncbi:MAG: DUF1641 domain-containing protein [Tuberibacillus sp.]
MAKPTAIIEPKAVDPVSAREEKKNELLDALLERKASIEALMDLTEKLDDRGILDLLNGLVGKGDKVLGVVMHGLNKPGVSDTLDHILNLGAFLSRLDARKLVHLADRINAGVDAAEEAVASGESTNVFDLLKVFKDPDINRALTALIGFLKGAGAEKVK